MGLCFSSNSFQFNWRIKLLSVHNLVSVSGGVVCVCVCACACSRESAHVLACPRVPEKKNKKEEKTHDAESETIYSPAVKTT